MAGATVEPDPIEGADPSLFNDDLAPTPAAGKTWKWTNIAALWVGMVVCVPTYMLAAGMVSEGMSWSQAVMTVLLGNVIVLAPMMLVGHAGTKHGIPFPVLLRSSFGTVGANVPALLRGVVACGWFGIQTWVGGSAIYTLINAVSDNAIASSGEPLPFLGIDGGQLGCFIGFWALHVVFIKFGTESIRWLETLAAPFLIVMGLALLAWAYVQAGGFGEMLSTPSQFDHGQPKEGEFWAVFFPSLTAMVGFWATLSLNIPDFTRYCRTQKDQILGQAIGLRGLGGVIMIDPAASNDRQAGFRMAEALGLSFAAAGIDGDVKGVTRAGLVEVVVRKQRESVAETLKRLRTRAYAAIRTAHGAAAHHPGRALAIRANVDLTELLGRDVFAGELEAFRARHGVGLHLATDDAMARGMFDIVEHRS